MIGRTLALLSSLRPTLHRALAHHPLLSFSLGTFLLLSLVPLIAFVVFLLGAVFTGLALFSLIELTLLFWASVVLFWVLTGATFLGIVVGISLWLGFLVAKGVLRRFFPSLLEALSPPPYPRDSRDSEATSSEGSLGGDAFGGDRLKASSRNGSFESKQHLNQEGKLESGQLFSLFFLFFSLFFSLSSAMKVMKILALSCRIS